MNSTISQSPSAQLAARDIHEWTYQRPQHTWTVEMAAERIQSAIFSETALIEKQVTQLLDVIKEKNGEIERAKREANALRNGLERIAAYDAPDAHAMIEQARNLLSKYPPVQS